MLLEDIDINIRMPMLMLCWYILKGLDTIFKTSDSTSNLAAGIVHFQISFFVIKIHVKSLRKALEVIIAGQILVARKIVILGNIYFISSIMFKIVTNFNINHYSL